MPSAALDRGLTLPARVPASRPDSVLRPAVPLGCGPRPAGGVDAQTPRWRRWPRPDRQQLQRALDSRTLIEQAKGITAERHGISVGQAFERLRGHARSNNLKLRDVCDDVINGELNEI